MIEILSYSKSILIRLLINWLNWDAVMRRNKIIEEIEKAQEKEIPEFNPGDTVSVSVRVKEGERERLQAFDGVVIGKRNKGINSSFIVRKISHGVGVERTFQTHSPLIASIEVKRRGDVEGEAVLPKERSGRSARIKKRFASSNKPACDREREERKI